MKNTFYALIPALLLSFVLLSGCGEKEHFVDARDIFILNSDTLPTEISVNNEKAVTIKGLSGSVWLNSGDYEISAKRDGKEIGKITVSLPAKSDGNKYDRFIWDLKGRNYALLDMRAMYFDSKEFSVEKRWFGEPFMHVESSTYHIYYPWNTLPSSIYAVEGSTADIYQLFELPGDYKDKSDADVIAYCEPLMK